MLALFFSLFAITLIAATLTLFALCLAYRPEVVEFQQNTPPRPRPNRPDPEVEQIVRFINHTKSAPRSIEVLRKEKPA